MNKSTKKMLCLGMIVLMLTGGLPLVLPSVSATNDPPATPMATTNVVGDWTVLDTRTYTQMQIINMQNGNVRVASGGRLTLDFAALRFNSLNHGQHGIIVEDGGYFEMRNNAYLLSNSAFSYYCQFLSGSTIKLGPGATIQHVGGQGPGPQWTGVYVGTVNATIDKMTFRDNGPGFPLVFLDNDVTITNSSFIVRDQYAVFGNAPNNISIYDSNFDTNLPGAWQAGVYVISDTNATVENCRFIGQDMGIDVSPRAYLKAKNNIIANNSDTGINVNELATADLIDNTINDNNQGIRTDIMSEVNMWGHNKLFSNNDGVNLGGFSTLNSKGTEFRDSHNDNIFVNSGTVNITGGLMVQTVGQSSINMMSLSTGTIEGTDFRSTSSTILGLNSGSTLMMNKCTFDANYHFPSIGVTTGSTLVLTNSTINKNGGLMTYMDGTILSSNNTFIEFQQMFFTYAQSTVISRNDQGKSAQGGAVAAHSLMYSTVDLKDMDVNLVGLNTVIGTAQDHSTLNVMDSKFSQDSIDYTYAAVLDSQITAINSPADPTQALADEEAIVDFGWHTQVRTVWQNGAVAPNAQVVYNNQTGYPMSTLVTDNKGLGAIDIIATTVDMKGITEHNDYNLTATLDGMTGVLRANVSDNMVGVKQLTVKITDTDSPLVNITVPEDQFITNAHSIDIAGFVKDNGSGIAKVEVSVGAGAAKEVTPDTGGYYLMEDYGLDLDGDEMIAVVVTDNSGLKTTVQRAISVDWTDPTITVNTPTKLYLNNGTFYLNGSTEPNAVIALDGNPSMMVAPDGNFSIQLTKPDGTYNFKLLAEDLAGNTFETSKDVIVDTIAPAMTYETITTPTSIPALKLKGTLTDATGGPALMLTVNGKNATLDLVNKTWSMDLTLVEGPNQITMLAKDTAGNVRQVTTTILLDTVAPEVGWFGERCDMPYFTNKGTINLTGKVTELNLDTLKLNGANISINAEGNFTTTVTLVNGTNTLTLIAKDKAGNSAQLTCTVILDTVAPKVTILSPVDGFLTNQATVEVQVFVDDGAATVTLQKIRMRNDQPVRKSGTANLTTGLNTLTVEATDLAGNVGTATVKVTYDSTATLTVTSPPKSSVKTTSPSITIKGTAEPGSKVYVNDVLIPSNADGTFTYKMLVKEGKTKVTVKAVDPAGNTAPIKTFTATRTEAKQFEMTALLGLGIVLMIIGLIIGVVVGKVISKPKAPKPVEDEYPEAPTKTTPAPVEEEKPFTPEEEEPEEPPKPAPAEKGSLKDKQKDAEAKPTETDTKPKAQPKPEPKPEPKVAPKVEPKPKGESSLDDLLKNLDKK